MDDDELFREASLQIHSSLDVEKAMARCLPVLRKVMPARRLWLFLFDREEATLRLIAQAEGDGEGQRLDHVLKLSPAAASTACALEDGCVAVENVPHLGATPLSRQLRDVFDDVAVGSYLAMLLEIEGKRLAYLAVSTPAEYQYDAVHERFFASLKGAFSLTASHALRHEEVVRLTALLDDDNRYLRRELVARDDALIGKGRGLREVATLVAQVAGTATPVLLSGETGVGKEVVAKAIHQASPRREAPLVTVNCGAIPDSLLDSELFGHERGAFTGAVASKRGRFERAHRGTLFLDEVGELPPSAQVRLLRVLSEKQIERVGGTEPVPVDVRIVAATHRDLPAMVREGTFREDLWFRLAVFPIAIPPLRDRTDDLPDLLTHFIRKKARELGLAPPRLAPGSLEALAAWSFPGNVRQLENLVERALILDPRGPLRIADLLQPARSRSPSHPELRAMVRPLDDVVAEHVRHALEVADGRVHGPGGAAELLGINASTLRARMGKLGISFGKRKLARPRSSPLPLGAMLRWLVVFDDGDRQIRRQAPSAEEIQAIGARIIAGPLPAKSRRMTASPFRLLRLTAVPALALALAACSDEPSSEPVAQMQATPLTQLPEGYGIDRTEVTRDQYAAWLRTSPTPSPGGVCGWKEGFAPSARCEEAFGDRVCRGPECGQHPQVCVDWCDAAAYCAAAGQRLCGKITGGAAPYGGEANPAAPEGQWENACSAHGRTRYPYGDEPSAVCNGLGAGLDTTVAAGALASCQSSIEGYRDVLDLGGNVWEWEDSCASDGDHAFCQTRGGAFNSDPALDPCSKVHRYPRDHASFYVGFRCCS